jgi:retinol dehydrogenase-12
MFGGLSDNGFRPDNDIPDLTGKVILVTGGKVGSNFCTSFAR